MMEQVLFVTGIDTNIGKTYATAFLADMFRSQGSHVCTQKMVQTGCKGIAEDIATHRRLSNEVIRNEDKEGLTCPYVLSYPASPHLAAEIDGETIDPDRITESTLALFARGYDMIILEGAGGLMVPINRTYLTIDYIAQHQLPVALVTSGRLGSINHTLLSLEVCRSRGIRIAYVVYNHYPSGDRTITEDTLRYITNYLHEHHPDTQVVELPIQSFN